MADLQVAPPREKSALPAVLIAVLVLCAAAAAIFHFNPHRVADLQVTGVDTFAPHTTFSALEGEASAPGTHVLGGPTTASEDNLYVVASVKMTNKLRLPIFFNGAVAHVTMADGSREDVNMLSASDVKRLAVIFPAFGARAGTPLEDEMEIDPGQTVKGTAILPFPGQGAEAWAGKKAATLTVSLRNQEPQTTRLP